MTVFAARRGRYERPDRLVTSRLFKTVLCWISGVPVDVGTFFVVSRGDRRSDVHGPRAFASGRRPRAPHLARVPHPGRDPRDRVLQAPRRTRLLPGCVPGSGASAAPWRVAGPRLRAVPRPSSAPRRASPSGSTCESAPAGQAIARDALLATLITGVLSLAGPAACVRPDARLGSLSAVLHRPTDALANLWVIKTVVETGSPYASPALGAPFGAMFFDFPRSEVLFLLFYRAAGLVTANIRADPQRLLSCRVPAGAPGPRWPCFAASCT